ncbi:RNA helicase [Leucoagaricus gongylophorus]
MMMQRAAATVTRRGWVCVASVQKRTRSTKSRSKPKSKSTQKNKTQKPAKYSKFPILPLPQDSSFLLPDKSQVKGAPSAHLPIDQCHAYFQSEVQRWSTNTRTLMRFARFGYKDLAIRPFLDAYANAALSGFFGSPENLAKYQLTRFTSCGAGHAGSVHHAASQPHLRLLDAEIIFSNIFFSWIANSSDSSPLLEKVVQDSHADRHTLDALRHLAMVSERRPAEYFTWARKMQRKFIMHVGPTNSGKTHHALRALAAARNGVYAGPLRLLAYEIWERLNLGQIIPLGVDVPPPSSSPKITQIADKFIAPEAKMNSNPTYARLTNMVTGEERKVVDEDAPLLTCTIEMLSFRHKFDVGVIDEIQMIGDPERGFAWTDGVLGLCAKEIHLCGEESAVPVVRQLLQETGDELTIKRYERLTPLLVEEQSLDGSLSNVVKGDCVVAFSRSRIFEIKQEIETSTGLRCAVVYGKLPPEIRSEQAALFNNPDSGFDVMIGSDAIGMGLNLKIRRIIFDATSKPSAEHTQVPLSVSQIKQIAGRAGRYRHSLAGEKPGGYVTTLKPEDLPVLREALAHPSTPAISHAYIGPTVETLAAIAPALSPSSEPVDLETAQMAHVYTALPPSSVYKHCHKARLSEICTWIEAQSKGEFTWQDKLRFMFIPIPWRDRVGVQAAEEMAALQRDKMCVVIENMKTVVGGGGKRGLISALEKMEQKIQDIERGRKKEGEGEETGVLENISLSLPTLSPLRLGAIRPLATSIDPELLEQLEALHKILVMYMWSHFKNNVVYPGRDVAENLKNRVEVALDWGLREFGRDGAFMKKGERLTLEGVDGWSTNVEKKRVEQEKKEEQEQEKKKKNIKVKKEKRVKKKGKGGESEKGTDRHYTSEDYEGGFRSFENYNSPRLSSSYYENMPIKTPLELGKMGPPISNVSSTSSPFYPPPTAGSTARSSAVTSAILSMRNGGGGVNSGNSVSSAAGWKQAPDLTALLKMYVDNPSLRVDGSGSGRGGVRK